MVQYYCLHRVDFSPVTNVQFTTCQWRLPPLAYVLYRIALACYTLFCLFDSFMEFQNYYHIGQKVPDYKINPWPFYLSNISYLLLTLYLVFNAVLVSFYVCRRKKGIIFNRPSKEHIRNVMKTQCRDDSRGSPDQNEANGHMLRPLSPGYKSNAEQEDCQAVPLEAKSHVEHRYFTLYISDKITWVLYIIASNAALTVTLGHFILKFVMSHVAILHHNILHVFVFNSVIVVCDHFITAIPVKPLHFVYVSAFGVIYELLTIFNCFALNNTEPVYGELLDWHNNPGYSVLTMFVILFVWIPLVQLFLYLLFKFRLWIFESIYVKQQR